jgi:hypothetical protein
VFDALCQWKRTRASSNWLCGTRGEVAVRRSVLAGGDGEVKLRSEGRCWLAVTVRSSCGQQINDVFDRFVGPMVGGLEAAVGSVLRIGSMVEAAVGKGTTQPLMEEQKQ